MNLSDKIIYTKLKNVKHTLTDDFLIYFRLNFQSTIKIQQLLEKFGVFRTHNRTPRQLSEECHLLTNMFMVLYEVYFLIKYILNLY